MPETPRPDPRTAEHICSICRMPYIGYGNNAQPINDGRCCDECNSLAVIPIRIKRLLRNYETNP